MSSSVTDGTTTVVPQFVKGYTATQAGRSVFHDVMGVQSQDVTLVKPGLRSGTLYLYFGSWADAEACRALHDQAVVFQFADEDVTSAAMSYVVDSGGVQVALDETALLWTVQVAYREVSG